MPRILTTAVLSAAFATSAACAFADSAAPASVPLNSSKTDAAAQGIPPQEPPAGNPGDSVPQNDTLNATLWMQRSVEHRAVTTELFALAKQRLKEALASESWTAVPQMEGKNYRNRPVAIVSDLDETLLDNSNYESSLVTRGAAFNPKDWTKYVESETSGAMPGALNFLEYAASKGVKIFYVTNRTKAEEPATRANLKRLGFPLDAKVDTVLTKGEVGGGSAKGPRIASIASRYRVVLLMGDNFGDFTDQAKGSLAQRADAFKADRGHFGFNWIMFPNPEYGSWESAAFGNDWSKSPAERRHDKIGALQPWRSQE